MNEADMLEKALVEPEAVLDQKDKHWLTPLHPLQACMARAGYCLNRLLVHVFFALKVEGKKNLPEKGPFLIAANHASTLDSFVLAAALDNDRMRESYWAALRQKAFRTFLQRWICRLAQIVPIERDQGMASDLAFAAAVLQRGKNLIWFPEGRRSPTGELLPFKIGIGLLVERYPVPVIPVYIDGTHAALPVGGILPRPQCITVVFGTPTDRESLEEQGKGDESHERIARGLHDHVAKLRNWKQHLHAMSP